MTHNVVIPTVYGPMIVNRHGTEFECLAKFGQSSDHSSIELYAKLITCLGPHPLILDIGACFGCFSLGWAKILEHLAPRIIAFEPQQWLANCICGSIALNDLENVIVMNAAVGDHNGVIRVPKLDYRREASFGSLPMGENPSIERMHYVNQQPIGYIETDILGVDALGIAPTVIKIDVEGMEIDVLRGAERTIAQFRPLIFAEHIKGDPRELALWFVERDYQININDADLVCVPKEKLGLFPVLYNDTIIDENTGEFVKQESLAMRIKDG